MLCPIPREPVVLSREFEPDLAALLLSRHLRINVPYVGRQAHRIPMKGSQQLQTKTSAIAQVKSAVLARLLIATIRRTPATHTLLERSVTCN
jgi:hypothetical protein